MSTRMAEPAFGSRRLRMFASYPYVRAPDRPLSIRTFPSRTFFEPCAILVIIRRVHDHEIIIPAAAIDERVVDHVRIGREEMRIQRLARQQPAAVIAADRIEEGSRIRAAHIVHAHVRNIEQSRRIACGKMLFKNSRVLHRHFPNPQMGPFCRRWIYGYRTTPCVLIRHQIHSRRKAAAPPASASTVS